MSVEKGRKREGKVVLRPHESEKSRVRVGLRGGAVNMLLDGDLLRV